MVNFYYFYANVIFLRFSFNDEFFRISFTSSKLICLLNYFFGLDFIIILVWLFAFSN